MIFSSLVLPCLAFVSMSIVINAEGEIPCQKINFDTPDKQNIEKCPKINQEMTKKEYVNSKIISPFWKGAVYYLSNKLSKISCEQTKETFRMDQKSEVQMTHFLYGSQSASVTLKVIDLDDVDGSGNAKVVDEWKLDKFTEKWEIFYGKVSRNIGRAKVQIECNMNDLSTFAIEHLHIINPAMEEKECQQEDWYPEVSTTPESSTSSSTTVSSTTTGSSSSTTTSSTSSTEEDTTEEQTSTTSQSSTTQTESTTEDETTTTEEETTATTEIETSEVSSTVDPSTTSSETHTSTGSTNVETTLSSSTSESPSDDPDSDLLYLYVILALGATSIISGIIIFTIVVCKTTGSYQPKSPTTMSNVRLEPLNNASASSLSEISIVSDKSLQNMTSANKLPRIDAKRNDSGLSSNSTAVLQGS